MSSETILLGDPCQPCELIVRDARLDVVGQGVTPLRVDLPPGTYDFELRAGGLAIHRQGWLGTAKAIDPRTLREPMTTTVPIGAAKSRDYKATEGATLLSARLRESNASCGLVVVLLYPGPENSESASDSGTTRHTDLDVRVEYVNLKLKIAVKAEPRESWAGKSAPLEAGPYLLRLSDAARAARADRTSTFSQEFGIPLWVAAGYQTLVFVPCSDELGPRGLSVHMVPMTRVWTGFEPNAAPFELALHGLRQHRCVLSGHSLESICEWSRWNPMFGIVAARSLLLSGGDPDRVAPIAEQLDQLVPGHPDVIALGFGKRSIGWPPSLAQNFEAVVRLDASRRPGTVEARSFAEVFSGRTLALGAWSVVATSDLPPIMTIKPPSSEQSSTVRVLRAFQRGLFYVRGLVKSWACQVFPGVYADMVSTLEASRPADPAIARVRFALLSLAALHGRRQLSRAALPSQLRRVAISASLPLDEARRAVEQLMKRPPRSKSARAAVPARMRWTQPFALWMVALMVLWVALAIVTSLETGSPAIPPTVTPSPLGGTSQPDIAWMLVATAMVLLMTPALGFFYTGLVRPKNALNTLMMCFITPGFVGILWALCGYSLAFAGSSSWIGGLSNAFLNGVGLEAQGTIPHVLFMMFHGAVCILTAALISGAVVERMRFSAYVVFIALWAIVVYAPVAHWVWGGGWLVDLNVLDFAGGLVVHVNAGVAAFIAALIVGPRQGYPSSLLPHNLPFSLLGTGLLWFAWFGLNAGSALAANGIAALAFVTTMLAPAATLVMWTILDVMRSGKPTAVGAATAIIVGLVAVTPAAGFISPMSAIVLGLVAAVPSYMALAIRAKSMLDDSLDVAATHGVGGIVGALFTGAFAQRSLNGVADGLFFGNPGQVITQAIGIVAVTTYSGVMTFLLLKSIGLVVPLRTTAKIESAGLDIGYHGEEAYFVRDSTTVRSS